MARRRRRRGRQADASAEGGATATPIEAAAVVETLGTIDGGRVRFILTELRRSGPTVILNARLEPADDEAGDSSLQVSGTFDDGIFQELDDGTREDGHVFDGVALIDPDGKKKYLVARNEDNRCVCSSDLSAAFVTAGGVSERCCCSAPRWSRSPPRPRPRRTIRRCRTSCSAAPRSTTA